MGNMNCKGQKANSKEWNDNFDRIFNKRPFFDVIAELNEILKEANTKEDYDFEIDASPQTRCGELDRQHKMKRIHHSKTTCIYPDCDGYM